MTNLGDHNSVTKTSTSLHESGFFRSCNKGMGMMQPWCRAGGTHCGSQEPEASGREWMPGMAGMDSLDKHVEQISIRQCVTFCEHGQLKGWQPHFQPTVAKKLNLDNCSSVCSSHIEQLRAQSLHCNKSWRPQLCDQFLCLSA